MLADDYLSDIDDWDLFDSIDTSDSDTFTSSTLDFEKAPSEGLICSDMPSPASEWSESTVSSYFKGDEDVLNFGEPSTGSISPISIGSDILHPNESCPQAVVRQNVSVERFSPTDVSSCPNDQAKGMTVAAYRHQQESWLQNAIVSRVGQKRKRLNSNNDRQSRRTGRSGSMYRSPSLKIPEVLSYPRFFIQCVNTGDFSSLHDLMMRSLVTGCLMNMYIAPCNLPYKTIPREYIGEFFKTLDDAMPDSLWKFEDARLKPGKLQTVISNFRKSGISIADAFLKQDFDGECVIIGTLLDNPARDMSISRFRPPSGSEPENPASSLPVPFGSKFQISGTIYLELNSELKVSSCSVILQTVGPEALCC